MRDPTSIAHLWLTAFNAHDVPAMVSLYAEGATHSSPKIRALHPDSHGKLIGHAALAKWWTDSNARLPNLHYELVSMTADAHRVVIEYLRHSANEPPMPVSECFDITNGKITASRVYHG